MSFLLDISRSFSRVGLGQDTGIDRVERAYINFFLSQEADVLFLVRFGRFHALLDIPTVQNFMERAQLFDFQRPKGLDTVRFKLPYSQRQVRSFARTNAIFFGYIEELPAQDIEGRAYVNVGHTNLDDRVFNCLKSLGVGSSSVMVHDLIPLDYPAFTRQDTVSRFEARMKAVSRHATRVICNSRYTETRVSHWFKKFGRVPTLEVAHLGVDRSLRRALPKRTRGQTATFLMLGTIEPRKNHQLILKVWHELASTIAPDDMPVLHIVGRRGWNNEDVFRILDSTPLKGRSIFEANNLSDAMLAKLFASADALLFPSFVEGYGLPAIEAMQNEVPVICSDIPVFRELLGGYATFLDPGDAEKWKVELLKALKLRNETIKPNVAGSTVAPIPTWETHFETLFKRGSG